MLWDSRLRKDWRIIPIIAFSLLLLISIFILIKNIDPPPSQTSQVHILDVLPNFLAKDSTGRIVGDENLAAKNVFVQFTNSNDVNDIDFIGATVSAWKDSNLAILLITSAPKDLSGIMGLDRDHLLNDKTWLNQLNNVVLSGDKEYYLFALFASFCASCQQGSIVSDQNNVFLTKRHFVEVFSVVFSRDLSKNDINSLRDQAKIAYPIVGADTELSAKWASLIDTYNSSLLNNILILADREGRILKVFDVTCQCYGEFINFVRALEGPAI